MVGVLMNRHWGRIGCKSQQRFRLRFERLLREYSTGRCSAAEGFGLAWEKALEEVPLSDSEQAQVYWELIRWAKTDDLFTATGAVALETRSS